MRSVMAGWIVLCIFVGLLRSSFQRSTTQDASYVAAVVEYEFTSNSDTNLQHYLVYIQDAAALGADIIVFPELTLTRGFSIEVPMFGAIKDHPVPALSPELYDQTLVTLSEAAITNQIYIVVNFEEAMDCSSNKTVGEYCPESKKYLFNTNVVFDRSGAIIDRYRKINLFGEHTRYPALQPDLGVFSTDFGVTFGHFICFDLMFQLPSIQVVEKMNITDIVFPTMWFSEMPFLTAVQIQQAYAYALNVNFLGAGANNVKVGSAGSGIFSGKAGALISTMPGAGGSRLLVQRVPKVPGQLDNITYPGPIYDPPSDADVLFLKQDPSLKAHATQILNAGYNEFVLAQGDVTCTFRVRMLRRDGEKHYEYRASVFDGVRTFDGVTSGGARICTIMSCTGSDVDSCGLRFDSFVENTTAVFQEVFIQATVPTPVFDSSLGAHDTTYFPITLDIYTQPLESRDFTYTEVGDGARTNYEITLTRLDAEIYTFGVWGRKYDTDGTEPTSPGSSVIHVLNSFVLVPMLYLLIRN